MDLSDTIVAPATGNIASALGIVRLTGKDSLSVMDKIFFTKANKTNKQFFKNIAKANHLYYGTIRSKTEIIDEVVVSVFLAPHSFSGEDTVEITHHGSPYISQQIIELILSCGVRLADRGEFSLRAFLNGKINLSQAEAVADLIASNNDITHTLALKQLRGDYNEQLKQLRQDFLHIASLLELEIDFSAEQEVFIDRQQLLEQIEKTEDLLTSLTQSFAWGNAFKNGIPVAIVGKPNCGKSTLLNTILKEDRSIVSSTAGTTRDTIEETFSYNGLTLRFIDTAGIRKSNNDIEKQGIERSFKAMSNAKVILYLFDANKDSYIKINKEFEQLKNNDNLKDKKLIPLVNKQDISLLTNQQKEQLLSQGFKFLSAKDDTTVEPILKEITKDYNAQRLTNNVFVTNIRHYQAMKEALKELTLAEQAIRDNLSEDLISENIRFATNHIGQITGEITNQDILTNIFSHFCIGK